MTDRDWLAAFVAALGVPPPAGDDFGRVLALAAEPARGARRTAARSPGKAGATAQGLGAGSAA